MEITPSGITSFHNCFTLQSAAAEMQAVAAQNARVKDPVYHVMLSWAPGENPTDQQAFDSALHAMKSVGMDGHQFVFAVHRDTDNVHVHMAINRVNPDTFKAVYPDRDYYKLDYAMRELELSNGWQRVEGVYSIYETTKGPVIDWASSDVNTKGKIPTPAADMERHDGVESLFSFCRGAPRRAVAQLLKRPSLTWSDLHSELSKFGLRIDVKGRGLAVYNVSDQAMPPIKASDVHEELSKARLEKRLGSYEQGSVISETELQAYDQHRPIKRNKEDRDVRRAERAKARKDLRADYDAYKRAFVVRLVDRAYSKGLYTDLATTARERRNQVKSSRGSAAAKKALYSIIAFETARERERLKTRLAKERADLRSDPGNRPLPFRQWVEEQAAQGAPAAISQMRGWAYAEKRKGNELDQIQQSGTLNGIQSMDQHEPVASNLDKGITFAVMRDGTVRYRGADGGDRFVDHGRLVQVIDGVEMDRAAVAAALRHATEKFGGQLRLTGNPEFQQVAIEVMLQYKIDARLTDPHQKAHFERVAAEIRALNGKATLGGRNKTPR